MKIPTQLWLECLQEISERPLNSKEAFIFESGFSAACSVLLPKLDKLKAMLADTDVASSELIGFIDEVTRESIR